MIPKVHKKGTSFKGAAAYLLHDVDRASTSERVAWIETRNLPIDDRLGGLQRGEIAWRLMAATAMDQPRIKQRAWEQEQAELPEDERQPYKQRGGRKSNTHVMHITLSWKDHEADGLTKEEMLRAADSALATLGEEPGKKGGRRRADGTTAGSRNAVRRQFADEHQALIVCHDDTEHPHVHILVNRVHPEHGVMLPTSKEKLVLSRWAQRYEEERGEVLCEQRVINNRRRDQGDHWVQGSKDRPRHLHELEAANDNESDLAEKVRAEQRARDHQQAERVRQQRRRIKALRRALENRVAERRRQMRLDAHAKLQAARRAIRDEYEPSFTQLDHQQAADRTAFAREEGTYAGRLKNRLRLIDWKGLMTTGRRSDAMKEAFGFLAGGENLRSEALRRRQEAQMVALEKEQAEKIRAASEPILANLRAQRRLLRDWHLVKRQDVELTVAVIEATIRAGWAERRAERTQAWEQVPAATMRPLGERGIQTTTPNKDIKAAAARHMERMRKAREERRRDRGRDDDRSR